MKRSLVRSTCARNRSDAGQGMTEYIIVVALIAIAAIGVTTAFGGNVRGLMGATTAALAGDTSVQVRTQRAPEGTIATKTLKNFGQNN